MWKKDNKDLNVFKFVYNFLVVKIVSKLKGQNEIFERKKNMEKNY
jgi:hypothetical protein